MFNKIYEFMKNLFKENYKSIIFLICFFVIISYPVPYYIFTSGGITDLSDRFEIDNGYTQEGSYNLSYVTEIEGNVLTYIAGLVIPSWDVVEISNYQTSSNESMEDLAIRDRLSLMDANQNAILLAYKKAGKYLEIKKQNLYVYSVEDFLIGTSKIKVGDLLSKMDGVEIEGFDSLSDYIDSKEVGDIVELELIRNQEVIKSSVKIQEIEGKKIMGIAFYNIYDYTLSPKITFKFNRNESGSSAGLMTTLAIYDTLIEEDLTKGLKIAGTGTINLYGNVGEIGGVKYKLKGAVNKDADIFFAPAGRNYDECVRLKKENNYDIDIVAVSVLDDAINYLENLKS